MPEPFLASLGDAAVAALILLGGGAILVRSKYRAYQGILYWGHGFAVLAVLSFVGRIYWLGAASVVGAALCWGEAWRIYKQTPRARP